MTITWTTEQRKLSDLIPWPRNPRKINDAEAKRLVQSFDEFGQVETIAIGPNSEVYNGHQRLRVLAVEHGPDTVVDVRVASRPLTEKEREKLTVYLHRGAAGDWNFDTLLAEFDMGELVEWGFEQSELDAWSVGDEQRQITRGGRLYNAGEGHDVEPYKLAHRIEAAWRANGGLALDLYSGEGQLASWYKRRFRQVVTNDKAMAVGDVDYSLSVIEFIEKHIDEFIDFDYVDFDDEGSPAKEISAFFRRIAGKKANSFVLALTDGFAMNLKFRGKFNLNNYLCGDEQRQATRADYDNFDKILSAFIKKVAIDSGFNPTILSSYRGRDGNVIFQTWFIEPQLC